MKFHNIAILFTVMAILGAPAFSYIFSSMSINATVYPSGDVVFNMSFVPESSLSSLGMSFPSKLVSPSIDSDGSCSYSYHSLGTLIKCNGNISRLYITARTIGMIEHMGNSEVFHLRFPVLNIYRNASISVSLPEGYILSDPRQFQAFGYNVVEPPGYSTYTNGRKIYVKWHMESPELGKPIEFRVIYEKAEKTSATLPYYYWVGALAVALVAVVVAFAVRPRQTLVHALDRDERLVYEAIGNRRVKQGKLVKELDMSKAKLSRIVKRLAEKGLIRKTRRGRDNLLEVVR